MAFDLDQNGFDLGHRVSAGWLRRLALSVVLLLSLQWAAPPAHAVKVMFGTSDYLEKIQDVTVKGPNNEALYLGYKYSIHSFVAPYMLSDDGYILGVQGQKSYFKLTTEQLQRFQANGTLPKPLPTYEIGLFNYLFGYLGWLIIAAIIGSVLYSQLGERKKKAALPLALSGAEHADAGNYESAIIDYDKALAIAPKFIDVQMARGNAFWAKGDVDRALGDFSKVIAGDAKHADALLRRGLIFQDKGLHDQAISDFSRLIKVSDTANSRQVRGIAYQSKGDWKKALADYAAVLKLAPDAESILLRRAEIYDRTGQTAEAATDRARAADLERLRAATAPVA
jgi:tetratricopeptide (TPR) repeat protein